MKDDVVTWAGLEQDVQGLIEAAGVPGAAVALVVDGQLWSAGIGQATMDGRVRMDSAARFSAYSVTKTIIATIVMKLSESGALSLDAPVREHLPDIPVETPVSIRQALNHTGGIPDYGGLPQYHEGVRQHPETPWTADQYLKRTLHDGLLFEPGHGWRYSNIGYMLLRQIIEQATDGLFREAVRRYVSLPLGLPHLEVVESLQDVAGLTTGYSRLLDSDAAPENVIPRYHPGWVAHGLVVSTAADLARFLDALVSGRIVGPQYLEEMLEPVPVGETHPWMNEPSYGLGLMIDPANRFGVVAGHTGGGPGYSTAAYHFPDAGGRRVTSVALANRDGSDIATDIAFSMVERVAGTPGV
jgi:D-alanyl-D-alanine carboxypeptidase